MPLSQFSFLAQTISQLQSWFIEIYNHLSAQNYNNGTWVPIITGMTGSPTVSAWYQRFGKRCDFTIVINGTHTMTDAEITLPIAANENGSAIVNSITDKSQIGIGIISHEDNVLKLSDYWVEDEKIIIDGVYRVVGI